MIEGDFRMDLAGPNEIVAAARSALNTKFEHQGRKVGAGLDCIGLLAHAADVCGIPYIDGIPYSTTPNGKRFLEALPLSGLVEIPIESAGAGDVLVFWVRYPVAESEPRHVAILTGDGRMIHTYARSGPEGDRGKVFEQELTAFWKRRIHSAWRYRFGLGVQ